MRTTIDLSDEHRARLLALAAERGEKGFSTIVAEAVELYLNEVSTRADALALARRLRGALPAADADALRSRVEEWRGNWR